jgi:hypothetical protein
MDSRLRGNDDMADREEGRSALVSDRFGSVIPIARPFRRTIVIPAQAEIQTRCRRALTTIVSVHGFPPARE